MIGTRPRNALGEFIPTGYGIAYYEPGRDRAVIMPVPFNLIVGGLRALWHWVQCPPWRFMEWRLSRARAEGYEAGQYAARLEAYNRSVDGLLSGGGR